jgi:two-component system, sensor histidine kinase and response regulator
MNNYTSMTEINPQDYIILIVDDLKENLMFLVDLLEMMGYKTTFANNGKQALEIVKITKPDLILLDLMMPIMDGLETCEKLKSNPKYQDIPIIFLTASQEQNNLTQAFALGAADYVMKPVEKNELLVRIKQQLFIKKQADQIRQKNLELELANQELQLFDVMICHDLKTPLTNIKGFTNLLQQYSSDKLDEKEKQFLSRIERGANKINDIINNLAVLSKVKDTDCPEFEEIDLSEMVEKILTELQIETPEREAKFIISPQISVTADSDLLEIALVNILNNAWKYSSKKQQTTIEFGVINKQQLQENKLDIKEEILNDLDDNEIIYFIRDNGVGFEQQEAEQIFVAFHRLTSQFEGTGIGLAIVERVINYHGGKIWCYGQMNVGATFYFTLKSSEIKED